MTFRLILEYNLQRMMYHLVFLKEKYSLCVYNAG